MIYLAKTSNFDLYHALIEDCRDVKGLIKMSLEESYPGTTAIVEDVPVHEHPNDKILFKAILINEEGYAFELDIELIKIPLYTKEDLKKWKS